MFSPGSAGDPALRAALTDNTVNSIFNCIAELSLECNQSKAVETEIENFPTSKKEHAAIQALKKLFDFYGSDKADQHNYHVLYGAILSNPEKVERIFEIGLGTNNVDVISNMGISGRPGASLRAFRDFCPGANIFGADIDDRILFQENRIATFNADQTIPETLEKLKCLIPDNFDLFIDDGLHSPDANINSLKFGLSIIKEGGWVVIEDIRWEARPIWQVISKLLPRHIYKVWLIDSACSIVFAVQKIKHSKLKALLFNPNT